MTKKGKQPQTIASVLNIPMPNYNVYYFSKTEQILYRLLLFWAGGVLGLILYGNQFLDDEGFATRATNIGNAVIFVIAGIIACRILIPFLENQLRDKRKSQLTLQFQSFLAAISVALSAGQNMTESLNAAYQDLKLQYSEQADIVIEVKEILNGIKNDVPIDIMMSSLGHRSGNVDIENFGIVFSMSFRTGSNLNEVVGRTCKIISEKISVDQQIETTLASNKTRFLAMMAIPVIMVLMLRMMSSTLAARFSTLTGVIAMTVALILFYMACKMGMKILDIKG